MTTIKQPQFQIQLPDTEGYYLRQIELAKKAGDSFSEERFRNKLATLQAMKMDRERKEPGRVE